MRLAARLAGKLRTLRAGRLYASLREHVDREAFEAICEHYRDARPSPGSSKYLDMEYWCREHIARALHLGLDHCAPLRVLDIGSGAGYFLFACRHLGHDVLGLDTDEDPLYGALMQLLRLERVIWRIERFVELPQLPGPFDLVTAFNICFNNHYQEDVWGPCEWEFFVKDMSRHLAPAGRLFLQFNPMPDGSFRDAALEEFFRCQGARVDHSKVELQVR